MFGNIVGRSFQAQFLYGNILKTKHKININTTILCILLINLKKVFLQFSWFRLYPIDFSFIISRDHAKMSWRLLLILNISKHHLPTSHDNCVILICLCSFLENIYCGLSVQMKQCHLEQIEQNMAVLMNFLIERKLYKITTWSLIRLQFTLQPPQLWFMLWSTLLRRYWVNSDLNGTNGVKWIKIMYEYNWGEFSRKMV